jgi:hypothetical protein
MFAAYQFGLIPIWTRFRMIAVQADGRAPTVVDLLDRIGRANIATVFVNRNLTA